MDWDSAEVSWIIAQALREDVGEGDITSQVLVPVSRTISAVFMAKQTGVLAGLPIVIQVFRRLDRHCKVIEYIPDGGTLKPGAIICRVTGNAVALLSGERVTLNFLQRLSGIATQTAWFVRLAAPRRIAVLDTRKTTPLLRSLEKYAVRTGGGSNHRSGLYDAILVKDNHLKLQPNFRKMLREFRKKGYPPERVEIEVTDSEMLMEAVEAGGEWFLLDNMGPSVIRKCIRLKRSNMKFEVSGGITRQNFAKYLIRGVDAISIGGLTHSAKSLDISMEIEG